MKSKYCLFLLFTLLFAGCATTEVKVRKTPAEVSLEEKIAKADDLLKKKDHQQAFILYSEALKEIKDIKVYRELQLKISSTQYEMKNYPAALAALAPMPELPATLNDCKKLVMAAKILQQMKSKKEYVEALLEVALDNPVDEPGTIPFKAYGYAELGKVYVANGKTARAVKCFEYAAKLYNMADDKENAKACRNIMEYLR